MWTSAHYVCFSWMGTQGSHSPSRSACVCVVMCVCEHICAGARRGVVLEQQTGLISDIKQSHISGREQTEQTLAPRLHLLQVHVSQPSTSRKHLSHGGFKSQIEIIDWSSVISAYELSTSLCPSFPPTYSRAQMKPICQPCTGIVS